MSHWNDNMRQPKKRPEPGRRPAANMPSAVDRRSIFRRTLWALAFLAAVTGIAETPTANGQAQAVNRENVLKAVYLYKFATYIRWPEKTFANANSPFVIAVFGPNPLADGLREIAAAKKIDGRKIELRHFVQPGDLQVCHILFMTKAVDGETQKAIIQQLSKRGVLFVGETKEFLQHGGVIDFMVRQNRIHMYISKRAYEREGLKVSAQLLRVMTVLE